MNGTALSWEIGFVRNLGGGGDKLACGYTILAMANVALSLILIVEATRQKKDGLALQNIFENAFGSFL